MQGYTADEADAYWMREALALADKASKLGEVPVGAVVVLGGSIVGKGWNSPISGCDPTAHAEIMALRQAASSLGNYRLVNASLYVTLEPCAMCAGAVVHSRIARLVYGATEPKAGVVESQQRFFEAAFLNHQVDVCGGVLASESSEKLSQFFKYRRAQKRALRDQSSDC